MQVHQLINRYRHGLAKGLDRPRAADAQVAKVQGEAGRASCTGLEPVLVSTSEIALLLAAEKTKAVFCAAGALFGYQVVYWILSIAK
jgi:hypothetical protein